MNIRRFSSCAGTIQLDQARLLDLLMQELRRSPLTDPWRICSRPHSSPCARICVAVASFPNESYRLIFKISLPISFQSLLRPTVNVRYFVHSRRDHWLGRAYSRAVTLAPIGGEGRVRGRYDSPVTARFRPPQCPALSAPAILPPRQISFRPAISRRFQSPIPRRKGRL